MVELDINESHEILCIHYFHHYNQDTLIKEDYLIVGGNFKKIQIYKFKNGEFWASLEGHLDSVTCFAQDGNLFMSGSDDMRIIVWNIGGEW